MVEQGEQGETRRKRNERGRRGGGIKVAFKLQHMYMYTHMYIFLTYLKEGSPGVLVGPEEGLRFWLILAVCYIHLKVACLNNTKDVCSSHVTCYKSSTI